MEQSRETRPRRNTISGPIGPRSEVSEVASKRRAFSLSVVPGGGMGDVQKSEPNQLSAMDGGDKKAGKAGFFARFKQARQALKLARKGMPKDAKGLAGFFSDVGKLNGMERPGTGQGVRGGGDIFSGLRDLHSSFKGAHQALSGTDGLRSAILKLAEKKKEAEKFAKGGGGDENKEESGRGGLSPMIQIRFGHHGGGEGKDGKPGEDGGKSPFGFPQITISGHHGGEEGKGHRLSIDFGKMAAGGGDKEHGKGGGFPGLSLNFGEMAKGGGQGGGFSLSLDFRKMAAGQGKDGKEPGGGQGGPGRGFALHIGFGGPKPDSGGKPGPKPGGDHPPVPKSGGESKVSQPTARARSNTV